MDITPANDELACHRHPGLVVARQNTGRTLVIRPSSRAKLNVLPISPVCQRFTRKKHMPSAACRLIKDILSPGITYIIQSCLMRYEPEHKTRTRDRIVRNAARKLRGEGLSGPGVASGMKAAGLPAGGFRQHFVCNVELLAHGIV